MISDLSATEKTKTENIDVLGYAKYSVPQKQAALQAINDFYSTFSGLPCPAKVLDFGCGEGSITQMLTFFSNIQEVHGVDVSHEMLAVAFCFNDHRKITYHNVDMQLEVLKGFDDHFDMVTAFNSLHWVRDISQTLSNIRRTMKTGSDLIGVTLARLMPYPSLSWDFISKHQKWSKQVNYDAKPDMDECCLWLKDYAEPRETFCRLLEDADFSIDSVSLRSSQFHFTMSELQGFLSPTLLKFVPNLPQASHDQYLNDIITHLSQVEESGIKQRDRGLFVVSAQLLYFCATNDH